MRLWYTRWSTREREEARGYQVGDQEEGEEARRYQVSYQGEGEEAKSYHYQESYQRRRRRSKKVPGGLSVGKEKKQKGTWWATKIEGK